MGKTSKSLKEAKIAYLEVKREYLKSCIKEKEESAVIMKKMFNECLPLMKDLFSQMLGINCPPPAVIPADLRQDVTDSFMKGTGSKE
jgi:hypothetical protein